MSSNQINSLSLRVSEDRYDGDAQFVLLVDGLQIGGVQNVTASHAAGQWQDIVFADVPGNNPSQIDIKFLNDAWGGSAAADRNLYVDALTLNGNKYKGSSADNKTGGPSAGTAAALHSNGTVTFHPQGTLVIDVSEDSYQGDAQFVVTVDGKQAGGVATVTASHSAGLWQQIALKGEFGSDPSKIGVALINDAWGGSAALDRNLYVAAIELNGSTYLGNSADNQASGINIGTSTALYTDGAITFNVGAAPSTALPATQSISFGANQYITLGDKLQLDSNQSWSVGSEIKVDALPPGPSTWLPDGGASLVFGNTNGAPYQGYELWLDDNGALRVRIMSSFLDSRYLDVAGLTDVADGKMHFIGATYDGSSKAAGVKLYVDGALEQSRTLSDTLGGSSASNGPMIIGNQLNGWQDQFQLRGNMFNFALSDVARDLSYFQPNAAVTPAYDSHTQVAFDFSAGSGLTVKDLSGYANDGILSDAAMRS